MKQYTKILFLITIATLTLSSCNSRTGTYQMENGNTIKLNSDYTATIKLADNGEVVKTSWDDFKGMNDYAWIESGRYGFLHFKRKMLYVSRDDLDAKRNGIKLKKK